MKVVALLLPLSLFLASPNALAEARRTFTLEQALGALRDGNLRLRAGRSSEFAATESVRAAGRWQNPQLDADYSYGIRRSSYDNAGTAVVGVSQLVETSGLPASKRDAARHEEAAVRADNRAMARRLELDVEEAYVSLGAQVQIVDTYKRLADELKEAERIITARVAAGTTSPYAAQRITLAHVEARALVNSAEIDIVNLRNDLNSAVGPMALRLVGDPTFSPEPREVPPLEALVGRQRAERHDLAAARERASEGRANIESAKRSVFRGVSVRVAAGFGQGPGQVDLGLGLSVPLPVVDAGGPAVRGAEHTAAAAALSVNALETEAEQQLRAAHAKAQLRLLAAQEYASRSREPSERIVREAEAGFREARLGVLELVDAYRTAHDAEASRIRLSRDAALAEIELRRAAICGR